MLFSSLQYLVFFAVIFPLYWLTSGVTRKLILLVGSYVFYMSWMPVYGLLLFIMTALNFFLGFLVSRFRENRLFFGFAIIANITVLVYYKYTNFIVSSVFDCLRQASTWLPILEVPQSTPTYDIILPLGISFFAFEFIHYLVDVRRGGPQLKNPIDFALFTAFFPSQIAGPIKRYLQFEKELNTEKIFRKSDFIEGAGQFIQGLYKKVALSDNLALITNAGFNNVQNLSTADAWVAMFAFFLQLYLDFSGYSDMGIGSARMLGIHLPVNFALPYFEAKNFVEFWERWHISLSAWLRDYVYIPLGGSRSSRLITNRNVLITFFVSGLWHGASWHFVAWGLAHGICVIISREYRDFVKRTPALSSIHGHSLATPIAVFFTAVTCMFVTTLFAVHTTTDALTIYSRVLIPTLGDAGVAELFCQSPLIVSLLLYTFFGLLFVDVSWLPYRRLHAIRDFFLRSEYRIAAGYICCVIAAIAFSPTTSAPFIYFQF